MTLSLQSMGSLKILARVCGVHENYLLQNITKAAFETDSRQIQRDIKRNSIDVYEETEAPQNYEMNLVSSSLTHC